MVRSQPSESTFSPAPTTRWWEYVKRGNVHCGPKPFGHHFRDRFRMLESGFVQCEKKVPNLARHLVELESLWSRGLVREADQYRIALEAQRIDVPSKDELRRMAVGAGYRPCDRWIFLYAIRGGGIVVAEVHPGEIEDMDRQDLTTPTDLIDYLGVLNRDR